MKPKHSIDALAIAACGNFVVSHDISPVSITPVMRCARRHPASLHDFRR